MRISHKRGEEPNKKKKQTLDEKVRELKVLLITEHNRKFERQRLKDKKK